MCLRWISTSVCTVNQVSLHAGQETGRRIQDVQVKYENYRLLLAFLLSLSNFLRYTLSSTYFSIPVSGLTVMSLASVACRDISLLRASDVFPWRQPRYKKLLNVHVQLYAHVHMYMYIHVQIKNVLATTSLIPQAMMKRKLHVATI